MDESKGQAGGVLTPVAIQPCPFCGGNATAQIGMSASREKRMCIVCQRCGASSETFCGEAHAQLLAAWNRRPTPAAAAAQQCVTLPVDMLQKALVALDAARINLPDQGREGVVYCVGRAIQDLRSVLSGAGVDVSLVAASPAAAEGVGGPTFYVRHPDDSYSVADPQPVKEQK